MMTTSLRYSNYTCIVFYVLRLVELLSRPIHLVLRYIYHPIAMYRLTHGFRRYTGNIPEVLISTARGRSPRAVLISTEGISLYTSKAMC